MGLRRVLIANRGAIAARIIRTLEREGLESVAVYAEADFGSAHVAAATAARSLGDGNAAATYLNAELLLDIAREQEADAVHPGYGFLSENPAFAGAVEAAGLHFLGPTPAQIQAFGLKHEARQLAADAEVPLLPGSGVLTDADAALEAAEAIGWPVILKSSAGGGGIGMGVCRDREELLAGFERIAVQAKANFGDPRVFVERYVARARHVEVQVFGDGEGRVCVLGDRDCSLQRRHQKIIEEAPAPGLADRVRGDLHAAARRLMESVRWRSAGTVEFLYDADRESFYFLEVNARLQVEHGVTELVTGIDIVAWMLWLADGRRDFLREPATQGHAMQARLYAEDPARDFRPSPGFLSAFELPRSNESLRVDTALAAGVEVPAAFDPLMAKLLTLGANRSDARERLRTALEAVHIAGVQSNAAFLKAATDLPAFAAAQHDTSTVAKLELHDQNIEVLTAGTQTSVQDLEGRLGYWHVGVPPSGAFDTRSLAFANGIVDNPPNAAGLEMLGFGPTLRFGARTTLALAGARCESSLDGQPVPWGEPFSADAGQTLTIGRIAGDGEGLRAYLAVGGGIAVPQVLGSRSTFDLGAFGGHNGRGLQTGDVLPIGAFDKTDHGDAETPKPLPPDLASRLTLHVVQGPHLAPEFLEPSYLDTLYGTEWEVHYNSSRTGIRLVGPAPGWARPDGGDAGLHPSNVHDNAYAFGAVDFTGDMPIILGPDGPSLGGFVSPAAVAEADRWKLGQLRPGDRVTLAPLPLATADELPRHPKPTRTSWRASAEDVVLAKDSERDIVIRAAGDRFVLIEFGDPVLELRSRLKVEALHRWLSEREDPALLELTPGVRSLQLRVPRGVPREQLVQRISGALDELGDPNALTVPSRIVHLPLAWDDPATQEATRRYSESVRADAPWCPRNIEFIRRMNGLPDEAAVKRIVYDASYLVLGLGDVYLGAPVATPVDPRHRLVTTKYNPARTWTPENAVGIGGAYLCIYGMEGPGGYQFVGRTLQVWNRYRKNETFTQPWLLRTFDQLRFHEVSNEELLNLRRAFPLGRVALEIEESHFALPDYNAFLAREDTSITAFRQQQQSAFAEERDRWVAAGFDVTAEPEPQPETAVSISDSAVAAESPISGSVWKLLSEPGKRVTAGEPLVLIESMKTEFPVPAPVTGVVQQMFVTVGTPVKAGQMLVAVDPDG